MSQLRGFIYAILSSAAFGFIPLFAVPSLQAGMNTSSVLFYRMLFSVLMTFALLVGRRLSLRISRRQLFIFAGLALLYTASSLFLLESYLYLPSGVATTIHFLYPAFVTIVMGFLFKEKVSGFTWSMIFLSLVGVWLLSSSGHGGTVSLFGVCIVLITVFAYGSYLVVINRTSVRHLNSLVITFYVLFFTMIFCGINLYVRGAELQMIPDLRTGINLLLLGIIPTLVSNLFLVLAVRTIGSTVTSVLGCMEPVAAVVLGVTFLGEHLLFLQYVGILIVLFTVASVILSRSVFSKKNPH